MPINLLLREWSHALDSRGRSNFADCRGGVGERTLKLAIKCSVFVVVRRSLVHLLHHRRSRRATK